MTDELSRSAKPIASASSLTFFLPRQNSLVMILHRYFTHTRAPLFSSRYITDCPIFIQRPGELNRLSADGSILLKNAAGGYGGSAGFLHQTSPAFQQQSPHPATGAHPPLLQSHHQSQPALMMNGKSPSRDLGGGSTPVLKTLAHTPRGDNNNAAQVLLLYLSN